MPAYEEGRTGVLLNPGQETVPRLNVISNVGQGSQQLRLSYFSARRSETINNLRLATGTTAAAATPTLVRLGIYQDDGAGNLTLLGSTVNDTTLLAAASTSYTKALSAGVALSAAGRYAVGFLIVTAAALPTLAGVSAALPSAEWGQSPRLSGVVTAQSDLPSTVAVGSISNAGSVIYTALLP